MLRLRPRQAPLACLLALSLVLLGSVVASAAPIAPTSWYQQGGTSANLGFAPSAQFNATSVSAKYATVLSSQQCQSSFVYHAASNSFFANCWNNDNSGNFNMTLWQIRADSGAVVYQYQLQPFASGTFAAMSAPLFSAPAVWEAADGSATTVFVQTIAELAAFRLGHDGTIASQVSVPMGPSLICSLSLTVAQSKGLLLLSKDATVMAYHAASFSEEAELAGALATQAWSYDVKAPNVYVLSALTEDVASGSVLFTLSVEQVGAHVFALDIDTGAQRFDAVFPFPGEPTLASAPLVWAGRAYVGIAPYGMTVINISTGSVLTNGTWALTSATGLAPLLWQNEATQEVFIFYACEDNDGTSVTYELCVADVDGNIVRPWDTSLVMGCYNATVFTSYPPQAQPIITANGALISASSSTYDMLSCWQSFDLHTGRQMMLYQQGPLQSGLVFGSPFVDASNTVYVLAASNDFTSTLSALTGRAEADAEETAAATEAGAAESVATE